MKRVLRWTVGAALAMLLLTAGPAPAAPAPSDRSALTQIPADAPIVIHIRGVEGTKDRLVALIKEALPEMAPMIVPKIEEGFKEGLEGRKLAGLPKDGPIFIVFTEVPKPDVNPPKMAVILAVNKYEEFRDGFLKEDERKNLKTEDGFERARLNDREDIFFVNKRNYAVICPSEDVAKLFAKKAAGGEGVAGKISKAQATKLLSADIGGWISLDTISKQYADQLKTAKEAAHRGLEQIVDAVPKTQRAGIEILKKMIDPVFQAVEDSQGVLLTAELRTGGVALHIETELRDGSVTSRALKGFKAADFKGLERMPPGNAFYVGFAADAQLLEKLGGIMIGVMTEADSKEAKTVAAALEQLAKAGPSTRIDGFSVPPTGIQIWHFEDPSKAVAALTKLIKATEAGGALQGGMIKDKPVVKEGAEKYGDFTLTSVELSFDLEKMLGGAELPEEAKKQLVKGMESLIGEKMHYWFGSDGKVVLTVIAKDWAAAEKLLEEYHKGGKAVGTVAAFRDVRKELPAEATLLGLMDAVQYGSAIVEMIKPMVGGFVPLPPNFPAKPSKDASYFGGAVTLSGERGSLDVFISAPAVHEAFKVFVQPFLPGS
jgi:hypothetical protein